MSMTGTGVWIDILLGLLMSLLSWVAAEPAQAQTVDECQADIAALKMQTQNAAKDQAGLIGKLASASIKLSQGKFQNALAKSPTRAPWF